MQSVEPNARGELPAAQRSLYLMLNFSKNHFSLDLAAETLVYTSGILSGVTIAAGEIKIKPVRLDGTVLEKEPGHKLMRCIHEWCRSSTGLNSKP